VNAGAPSSFSRFYYYSRTLTDGWTIRLREESDLTLFVPIQTSAVHLMDFYNAVFQSASDKNIALAPPVVSCILRLGQLELLVSARSVPVPWNLTALFVQTCFTRQGEVTLQAIPLNSYRQEKGRSTHPTLLKLCLLLQCCSESCRTRGRIVD